MSIKSESQKPEIPQNDTDWDKFLIEHTGKGAEHWEPRVKNVDVQTSLFDPKTEKRIWQNIVRSINNDKQ